jgi:hypothetical protein
MQHNCPQCDTLPSKVVFHILAGHSRLEGIRVRLQLCMIGCLSFFLCALRLGVAASSPEQHKNYEASHRQEIFPHLAPSIWNWLRSCRNELKARSTPGKRRTRQYGFQVFEYATSQALTFTH